MDVEDRYHHQLTSFIVQIVVASYGSAGNLPTETNTLARHNERVLQTSVTNHAIVVIVHLRGLWDYD